jgi:hypothetical protein
MRRKYTKEFLEPFVKSVTSMLQLLTVLGLRPTGGNNLCMKKRIEKFNIDISHFTGSAWSKGKTVRTDNRLLKYTLEEMFCENSIVATTVIRNYLENDPNFLHECSICKNTEWQGRKIPLELDHINGNNRDNRVENLRFICLNCHAQTHTFRGKNKNTPRQKVTEEEIVNAIKESKSIRQVLIKLCLTPKGGNYSRINEVMIKYDLKFPS